MTVQRIPPEAAQVRVADSPHLDSFGRLRTSEPTSIFDGQHQYDTQPLIWEDVVANGGTVTHLPNESSVRLRVTTTSNSSAIRQSRAYLRYQPGRSQLIAATFVCGAASTNVKKRIGYFDASNGVYFQQDGAGVLGFGLRTSISGSPVDSLVERSSWNVDKLDGSGPSGLTIDGTKAQILVIDLQWLGVGRVRVGFNINGKMIEAHQFLNANLLTSVYMTTANLPVRYEITATGAAGAQTDLIQICTAVFSEGGFEEARAYPFSASNGITTISVTTRRPVLSIRPKATFNSIVNRGTINLRELTFNSGSGSAFWELVYGGTLTGSSFASVGASSIAEFDVAASAISGGIPVASGFADSATGLARGTELSQLFTKLPLVLDVSGANPIPVSVVCTSFTGTVSVSASVGWSEHR